MLKLYFRQLGEGKILGRSGKAGPVANAPDNSRTISSDGTRKIIIAKVAAGIVKKIITEGTTKIREQTPGNGGPAPAEKTVWHREKNGFTYVFVDRHNNKTTRIARGITETVPHTPKD